jgi:hypothetical protein
MLKGFEDITYELTEQEMKTFVPILVCGFQKMCGTGNVYTNGKIRQTLKSRYQFDISETRMREMISYISQERQHEFGAYYLAASSSGYFMTNDAAAITKHAESLARKNGSNKAEAGSGHEETGRGAEREDTGVTSALTIFYRLAVSTVGWCSGIIIRRPCESGRFLKLPLWII